MSRMIDQIRASKLPSNMMQFAARGALSVPPDENIEILVYLARNNKIFGDLARMTLAGWDEKASLAAASNPETPREVLDYLLSPDNLRPKLLPSLLENPSVPESEMEKFAISASRESIEAMLRSARIRGASSVLTALRSNPYLTKEKSEEVEKLLGGDRPQPALSDPAAEQAQLATTSEVEVEHSPTDIAHVSAAATDEEQVSAYLAEHAAEIVAEQDKPFQPVGGIVDLLGADYFPVSAMQDIGKEPEAATASPTTAAAKPGIDAAHAAGQPPPVAEKRQNSMQKINHLDVKGRIQLALKGNKEERSILIRDGTKVVALAVLEAPKLSDGEV